MAWGDLLETVVYDSDADAAPAVAFAGLATGNLIVSSCFTGTGALDPLGDLLEAVDHHDTGMDDGHSLGYRVVQGGDPLSWGWQQPSADQASLINREFEGPWVASPLDVTDTTPYADDVVGQIAGPTATTSQNDELAVASWGYRSTHVAEREITAVDNSFIGLLNEHNNFGTGAQKSIATAYKILTATGTPQTDATFTSGGVSRSGALMATFKKAIVLVLDQEGHRFRENDGDEDSATWKAAQDTNINLPINTPTRSRIIVNATSDPATDQHQLEFRKSGGLWSKVQ